MQERTTLRVQKEIWGRFSKLADKRRTDTTKLIEQVLLDYLDNQEKEDVERCNINWLGFGDVDPC